MTWLVSIGLTNAAIASALALFAWGTGRCCRRPALTRLLWIIVLCKLLAPPLVKAPVGDWLPVASRWLPETATLSRHERENAVAHADPMSRGSGFASEAAHFEGGTTQSARARVAETLGGASSKGESGAILRILSRISPARLAWFVAVVWVAGSVCCLLWLAYRVWRFRDFLAWAAVANDELSRRVALLARKVGLRSSPQVFVLESAVVSPMLWGAAGRARLLFPVELIRRIDDDACDTLLLHELAHYARRDWLVRLLELVALVVYWWHPLVWWARREIEAAEEECCDAWVLRHRAASRRTYAEALLATLDYLCDPIRPLPPAACGLGAAALLRSRLTHIMCGEVALQPPRSISTIVLAGAAVVLPLSPTLRSSSFEAAARSIAPADVPIPVVIGHAELLESAASVENALDEASKHWYISRDLAVGHIGPELYAAAMSPDGKRKIEARTGNRTTLINAESDGRLDLSSYRIVSASFSPDSNRFVTAQDDENMVRLWDRDGGLLTRLSGSDGTIMSVAYSPDGTHVAAGAADGTVLIWDVPESGETAVLLARLAGAPDTPASCIRWSKAGDCLGIAFSKWSSGDGSLLVVWNLADTTAKTELRLEQSVGAIDWLDNDEMVVADWSGNATFIELESGQAVGRQQLRKETISAAAFSPDCPLLPPWQSGRLALKGE